MIDRLRVLTLNIWNRQGPWERRLPLIRSGLAALTPDVVGLQEVLRLDAALGSGPPSKPNGDGAGAGDGPAAGDRAVGEPDQSQAIAAGLGYYAAYAPAWHIGNGLHLGNAILSRFPIVKADNFPLPGEPGEESRALLYAELDAPCGRIPVFNTHLSWKLHQGYVRERQVSFIVERVRELAPVGDGFPPLLMGDFNAEPDSDEIRFLRGYNTRLGRSVYFADSFAAAGDGTPGTTFARGNPFAAIACEPDRRLDYIFVRGPDRQLRGEPLAARVVLNAAEDGVFPSDHYGVFAEIQAAPRALSV